MLTIIIPSYSRVDLLRQCLHSVVAHAPASARILVIDDASPAAVVSLAASRFPRVDVHRIQRHSGFAIAANTGIRLANTPFLELLNDDTIVEPDWTQTPLKLLNDHPDIAAVAPLVLKSQKRGGHTLIDSAGDAYNTAGFAQKRHHNDVYDPSAPPPCGPVHAAPATAAFYNRMAVLNVGGFAEQFHAYFEDVDLSLRLRRLGYSIHYTSRSIVHHHISSTYGRRPDRQTLERQSCNEERLFWRHSCLHDLPRHLAVLLAKSARRIAEGQLAPWITGRCRAWIEQAGNSNPRQ